MKTFYAWHFTGDRLRDGSLSDQQTGDREMNAQPAVYVLQHQIMDDKIQVLARTQKAAVRLCVLAYGGKDTEWKVTEVVMCLDDNEATEIGRIHNYA